MGKVWLDDAAERLLAEVQRELGEGATLSEAVRHLRAKAKRYDDLLRENHRSRRLSSG